MPTKKIILASLLTCSIIGLFIFSSCSSNNNPITQIFSNELTAKQRLDSANAEATRQYGSHTKLVLIFGKNVKSDGKTDISTLTAITSPDSIGAWLYIYRDTTNNLRVYTPDPVPGASDCIELTALFNVNTIISLIQDTSAKNIISGVMNVITTSNVSITTPVDSLIDSDASLNLANTTNPVLKLDENNVPSLDSLNGSVFFSSGSNQTINMFLMPSFSVPLLGLPPDLWVVNYKKTDTNNNSQNLVLATVVESNQIIGILTYSSKVMNLARD